MTRDELAILLENEGHNVIAEHIRAGSDPRIELGDSAGGLRKALRSSRYDDQMSRNAKATFEDIVAGRLVIG